MEMVMTRSRRAATVAPSNPRIETKLRNKSQRLQTSLVVRSINVISRLIASPNEADVYTSSAALIR